MKLSSRSKTALAFGVLFMTPRNDHPSRRGHPRRRVPRHGGVSGNSKWHRRMVAAGLSQPSPFYKLPEPKPDAPVVTDCGGVQYRFHGARVFQPSVTDPRVLINAKDS
jgi:hypothetical protein